MAEITGAQPRLFSSELLAGIALSTGVTNDFATAFVVPISGQVFPQAFRVVVHRATVNPWEIAAQIPVVGALRRGDLISVSYWVRSVGSDGLVRMDVEESKKPYKKLSQSEFPAEIMWKKQQFTLMLERSYGPNDIQFSFHFGSQKQTIELGGFLAKKIHRIR